MKLFRPLSERMTPGKWSNGKQTITGHWDYVWQSDHFVILLNSTDPVTGMDRRVVTYNDTPEWGEWKLIKKEQNHVAERKG